MKFRTGIGQDSHRFLVEKSEKKCIIAGLPFDDVPGMEGDSDGDVVFHAICNAITSLTHVPILGGIAMELYRNEGVTDSQVFLDRAIETLKGQRVEHVALTIEGKRPHFQKWSLNMRQSVASAMKIDVERVGMTFTSGDGLTRFGCGEGLMCFAVLTISENMG